MIRQFANQNLDDGTWETGAFSLLEHREYNKNGQSMTMIDRYHGLVLREYECNGYNDSDFYAVIWDEEKQAPKHIMWATTRGWTYACGCVVDATPEVREKYESWVGRRNGAWAEYYKQQAKYIPVKGKTIRSTTVKGKAKGKQGLITWVGQSPYGEQAIRFITDSGEAFFVSCEKAEILNEETGNWLVCARHSKQLGWTVSDEILSCPNYSNP